MFGRTEDDLRMQQRGVARETKSHALRMRGWDRYLAFHGCCATSQTRIVDLGDGGHMGWRTDGWRHVNLEFRC